MANINEILARAAALRDETALNSISPERAGGIMYDTLLALNELWLQQGSALVISKIYASVAAMEADTEPVSDLTGKPLRPGQIVVIASSDSDNGSVYRYNGTEAPRWSKVGSIGNLEPVDNLDSDSTTLPLAAHQGKVLDSKISQLGQLFNGLDTKITDYTRTTGNIRANGTIGSDSSQWHSSLIPVERGNVVKIKSTYKGDDAAIAFTTSPTPTVFQVLLLANQKTQENSKWIGQAEIPADGYVSVCYLSGDVDGIEITVHSSGVIQEIELLQEDVNANKENIEELLDYDTVINDYTEVEGYGIRIDGSVETTSEFWYSSPIPVKFGDVITIKSKYSGQGAAISKTDARGSSFNVLIGWDSKIQVDSYYYITCQITFTGYISVTYITTDNDITVTKKNAQTNGQAGSSAKVLGGDYQVIDCPTSYILGEIRPDGTTNTDSSYWHSYPVIIKAGDVITIKSKYSGTGTAIASLALRDNIYTPLKLWSSAQVDGSYRYINYQFKEDCLISFTYITTDTDITVNIVSSTGSKAILTSQDYTDKSAVLGLLESRDFSNNRKKTISKASTQSEENTARAEAIFRNEALKSEVHTLADSEILTQGICGYYDDGNGNITDGTIIWKLYKNGILYISGYGKFYDFIKGICGCNTAQDVISLTNDMSSDFWYYGFIEPNANGFENPQRPTSGYTYETSEVMVYSTKRFLPQSLGDSINPLNSKPYGYAAPWYIYRVETDIDNYPIENSRAHNIAKYNAQNPNGWTYNRICIEEDLEHGGITYIGDWTFYRLSSEYLVLPTNVTKIGCWGVRFSDILKYVVVGNNVTDIEDHGISRNAAMKYLKLPASVTSLGYGCFESNRALKRIMINGTPTIGSLLLSSCLSLVSIDASGIGHNIPEQMCSVCYNLSDIELPNAPTINNNAFYKASLSSIVIPENVSTCGTGAFGECVNLKDVSIDSPDISQDVSSSNYGGLIYYADILRIKIGLSISPYIKRAYKFIGIYNGYNIYKKIEK